MFAKSTTRRLARAARTTVTVDLDFEDGTVTTVRPAKRPARRNVRQAAIRASQLGLTV